MFDRVAYIMCGGSFLLLVLVDLPVDHSAGLTQLVECQTFNLNARGSSPLFG